MSDIVVKQRASVYTVMLVVAFLCLVVACLFLYFEMNYYEFMTKVPDGMRAKNAETEAQKTGAPAFVEEPETVDPAVPPMDPDAPMADPDAPMVDPAVPVEPAAMPADPDAM